MCSESIESQYGKNNLDSYLTPYINVITNPNGKGKTNPKKCLEENLGDIVSRDFLNRSKKNIKMWTIFKLRMSIQP